MLPGTTEGWVLRVKMYLWLGEVFTTTCLEERTGFYSNVYPRAWLPGLWELQRNKSAYTCNRKKMRTWDICWTRWSSMCLLTQVIPWRGLWQEFCTSNLWCWHQVSNTFSEYNMISKPNCRTQLLFKFPHKQLSASGIAQCRHNQTITTKA